MAEYHLVQGTFETMCNEKYYKTPINLGVYIVEHVLEKVLYHSDIKAYEFCQMMNHDNDICEYYWAH